ncbi:MAG: glycosyltransferase family 4 protein [Kiritimatiellia bacterium]
MKIAYVVAEFPSLTETFILRELNALVSLQTELTVFALRRSASPICHEDARAFSDRTFYPPPVLAPNTWRPVLRLMFGATLRFLALCRISLPCCPGPITFLKSVRHFVTALHFAEECRSRGVEHVHAHFAHLTCDVARVIAELCRVSWSASVHAWDIYVQRPKQIRMRLADADFVLCCTEHARRLVRQWLPEKTAEIHLVRHGLPLDSFRPTDTSRTPFVVAVGRLVPKKGFPHLIEACFILNQRKVSFHCSIAGDGPLRSALLSQIERRGLSHLVRLEGSLPQEAVRRLLASAAVFVAPSIVADNGDRDGLPNALLEAFALETPVIVTDASAAAEVVRDGWNGFVVPAGNPEALAEKIEAVLHDPNLRARMGRAGREVIRREFNAAHTGTQLLDLFTAAYKRKSKTQ